MRAIFPMVLIVAFAGCAHTRTAPVASGAPDASAELEKKLKECDAYLGARKLDEAQRCAVSVEESGTHSLDGGTAMEHNAIRR
jgi:hypothetical protein